MRAVGFLDVHKLEQPEGALRMIEEQIDVGILARLVADGRAEQI